MKNNTVFVIPFVLPWEWSADFQRQTCLELSKKYTVHAYMQKDAVFFLKALMTKKISYPRIYNITFYRPLYILPFRRVHLIERINQIISYKYFEYFILKRQPVILWIFDPEFYLLPRFASNVISLYDCVDYVWSKNTRDFAYIKKIEKALIKQVQYFFVNSHILHTIHSPIRVPDAILPQGFRLRDFEQYKGKKPRIFGDKIVIGFVGAINHRLDFTLISGLAKRNPRVQFVLWGKIQEWDKRDLHFVYEWVNKLRLQKNIMIGHSKYPCDVPHIIHQFDIAIIPYIHDNDAITYCYPMKLLEYFYMGKPVISTPIEELKHFPHYVRIGATPQEWESYIKVIMSRPWPMKNIKQQKRLAEENSWEKKIRKILHMIKLDQ